MEQLLPILINTVIGGGGGYLGSMIKKNGLGLIGNLLSGALGGNAAALGGAAMLPAILGAAEGGGFNIASLVTALVGGGAGSLLGGLLKK